MQWAQIAAASMEKLTCGAAVGLFDITGSSAVTEVVGSGTKMGVGLRSVCFVMGTLKFKPQYIGAEGVAATLDPSSAGASL